MTAVLVHVCFGCRLKSKQGLTLRRGENSLKAQGLGAKTQGISQKFNYLSWQGLLKLDQTK